MRVRYFDPLISKPKNKIILLTYLKHGNEIFIICHWDMVGIIKIVT